MSLSYTTSAIGPNVGARTTNRSFTNVSTSCSSLPIDIPEQSNSNVYVHNVFLLSIGVRVSSTKTLNGQTQWIARAETSKPAKQNPPLRSFPNAPMNHLFPRDVATCDLSSIIPLRTIPWNFTYARENNAFPTNKPRWLTDNYTTEN